MKLNNHLVSKMTDREYAIYVISVRTKKSESGCLIWTGMAAGGRSPYAGLRNRDDGSTKVAHRFIYEQLVKPVAEGLQLDHLCRNTMCVNPLHLEEVTGRENLMRGNTLAASNSRKTICKNGHPFTKDNTLEQKRGGKVVGRECRECRLQIYRRHHMKVFSKRYIEGTCTSCGEARLDGYKRCERCKIISRDRMRAFRDRSR